MLCEIAGPRSLASGGDAAAAAAAAAGRSVSTSGPPLVLGINPIMHLPQRASFPLAALTVDPCGDILFLT